MFWRIYTPSGPAWPHDFHSLAAAQQELRWWRKMHPRIRYRIRKVKNSDSVKG